MKMSVSEARANFGAALMRVQNPNTYIAICRYGKPVAGLVSMAGLNRIWEIEDEEEHGKMKHPLLGTGHHFGERITWGRNGRIVTKREAALEVRTLQLTRAEERRILREGGLKAVEGGEVVEEREGVVPKRGWWFW